MKDKELLKEVRKLGFKLFEKEEPVDVNKVLYDVVKSGEVRFLEGFPVVLANAMSIGGLDYKKLMNRFRDKNDKKIFMSFLELSLAVYRYNRLKFIWENDGERIKNIFRNYYKTEEEKTREILAKTEELSSEYALSQIFSPKQKNLFMKKLRGEKMTKTEKEYYSRVVKKKAIALSNSELHNLARKILEQ